MTGDRRFLYGVLLLLLSLVGCGPRAVVGGTPGTVRSNQLPLADIQVNVYAAGSSELVGFGVSSVDGGFQLVSPGAKAPLHLPTGEYVITVESVGPDPLLFPLEFTDSVNTPLKKSWGASETSLDVELPVPTLMVSPVPM